MYAGGSLDERWPAWRKALSAFGNFYARTILSSPLHDMTTGFRMWRREALQDMPLDRIRSNGYIFLVEMAYVAYLMGFQDRQKFPFTLRIAAGENQRCHSKSSLKPRCAFGMCGGIIGTYMPA